MTMKCSSTMSCSSGFNWAEYTQFLADRKTEEDVANIYPNQPPDVLSPLSHYNNYVQLDSAVQSMYSQPSRLSPGLDAFSRAASARADNSHIKSQPLISSSMMQPSWAPHPSAPAHWGPRQQSVLVNNGNQGVHAFSTPPRNVNIGGMSTVVNNSPSWHSQSSAFERAERFRRHPTPNPARFQNCRSNRSYDSHPYWTTRTSVPSYGKSRGSSMERSSRRFGAPLYNSSLVNSDYSTPVPSTLPNVESAMPYSTTRYSMPSYGESSGAFSTLRSSVPSYDSGRGSSLEHTPRSFVPGYGSTISESSYAPSQFNNSSSCTSPQFADLYIESPADAPRVVAIPLKPDSTANDDYELDSDVSEASVAVMETLALTEVREKENMLKKLEDMQSYRRKFILGALPEPPEIVLEKCVQNLMEADSDVCDSMSTEIMETNLELEGDDSDEEDEYFHIVQINNLCR